MLIFHQILVMMNLYLQFRFFLIVTFKEKNDIIKKMTLSCPASYDELFQTKIEEYTYLLWWNKTNDQYAHRHC